VNTLEIDGAHFSTLEEFYDEVSRELIPGSFWGRNLDALNDILWGGFGTPEEGFTLRWRNHHMSKERLGYDETVRQLAKKLERCHPSHRETVSGELLRARARQGPTVFDWLLEIIADHPTGFSEPHGKVELLLE
jgi:RNAse (barnase) inhibitor barstar